MGTPRPTIEVYNLDTETRPWPKGANQNYDNRGRYCFRIGKMQYVTWKWPWPEVIGIPIRETLAEWVQLIDEWKIANIGKFDDDHVEKCIRGLIHYL
jgi:hypothetical protein